MFPISKINLTTHEKKSFQKDSIVMWQAFGICGRLQLVWAAYRTSSIFLWVLLCCFSLVFCTLFFDDGFTMIAFVVTSYISISPILSYIRAQQRVKEAQQRPACTQALYGLAQLAFTLYPLQHGCDQFAQYTGNYMNIIPQLHHSSDMSNIVSLERILHRLIA